MKNLKFITPAVLVALLTFTACQKNDLDTVSATGQDTESAAAKAARQVYVKEVRDVNDSTVAIYRYDSLRNLSQIIYPDTLLMQFSYNAVNGISTINYVDYISGTLLQTDEYSYPATPTFPSAGTQPEIMQRYSYDAVGNKIPGITVNFEYDTKGRKIRERIYDPVTMSYSGRVYTYSSGNLVTVTFASGSSNSTTSYYSFDTANNPYKNMEVLKYVYGFEPQMRNSLLVAYDTNGIVVKDVRQIGYKANNFPSKITHSLSNGINYTERFEYVRL